MLDFLFGWGFFLFFSLFLFGIFYFLLFLGGVVIFPFEYIVRGQSHLYSAEKVFPGTLLVLQANWMYLQCMQMM